MPAVVLPGCFDPLDACLGDVAVFALERVRVDHEELDQLVDIVAKRRQAERLALAERLAPGQLPALRLFRLEVGIPAESVQVRRIGRPEAGAGRDGDTRSGGEFEAVFDVPGRMPAEDVVV